MIEHPENYRWSNIGNSRYDSFRINVDLIEEVLKVKRSFIQYQEDTKIAKHISHTVYPPMEQIKSEPKISHTVYPPNYEHPDKNN